jgi:hypothetical protein
VVLSPMTTVRALPRFHLAMDAALLVKERCDRKWDAQEIMKSHDKIIVPAQTGSECISLKMSICRASMAYPIQPTTEHPAQQGMNEVSITASRRFEPPRSRVIL